MQMQIQFRIYIPTGRCPVSSSNSGPCSVPGSWPGLALVYLPSCEWCSMQIYNIYSMQMEMEMEIYMQFRIYIPTGSCLVSDSVSVSCPGS
jgi:hypothetical protein